jgi:transketolase
MIILQPGNAAETEQALAFCVKEARENCALRLIIGPSPRHIELPAGYRLTYGQGVTLAAGADAVLLAYGPVMLHEALLAHELLAEHGYGLQVVNLPWLNRADPEWLSAAVAAFERVYVLDDHAPVGGLGDHVISRLAEAELLGPRRVRKFAVEGYPACGTPQQALQFHRLDGASLAGRILAAE